MILRLGVSFAVVLYATLFFSLHSLPFLDLPNHLTRAVILKSLFFDPNSPYASLYGFEWLFNTYILGDLLLIGLLSILPVQAAAIVFVSSTFFLLPLSLVLYARQRSLSSDAQWLAAAGALFLSANWFFLSGFLNYQFSISLAFFTLLIFEKCLDKSTILKWLTFSLLVLLTYFMHVASFVLCGAAVVVILANRLYQKKVRASQIVLALFCFAVVSILHLWIGSLGNDHAPLLESFEFRTPLNKLEAIGTMFYRFNLSIDAVLCLLFAVGCAVPFLGWRSRPKQNGTGIVELLLVSLISFVVYIVSPVAMRLAYDVDNRALPFVFIFLLLASLTLLEELPKNELFKKFVAWSLLTTALLDASYLLYFLPKEDSKAAQYQELIDTLPERARVLPVATIPDIGRIQTSLHLGSFYTLQKQGYTPYLFSRTESHPQTYFYFKDRLYAPDIFWYLRGGKVDWEKVASSYELMIVTKPFDKVRFPANFTEPIAENSVAAVFRIN